MLKKSIMFLAVCLLLAMFAVVIVYAATANLPKSGQTGCYNEGGGVILCAGTGQDGDLQKGVFWPSPRFTNHGDQTITDNVTGLMWTQNGNAPGPGPCTPGVAKTWQQGLDYAKCLNTNNYLGHNDWRLPNRKELRSLINYSQADSSAWLNTRGFNSVQTDWYWSSTTCAFVTDQATFVYMYDGTVFCNNKPDSYYVWPVRAGH